MWPKMPRTRRELLTVRGIRTILFYPLLVVFAGCEFWHKIIGKAWNSITLGERLIWLFFFINTVCIITLLELLLFKQ